MHPGKKMQQACFTQKLKKILQLWLYRAKQNYLDYAENSKESLFLGELSDARRDSKSLEPVPKGFLAVYVGPEHRRFVIPMAYLSIPDFRALMDSVAEEYGFEQEGGLEFPCEEEEFEDLLLRCLEMMPKNKKWNNKGVKM